MLTPVCEKMKAVNQGETVRTLGTTGCIPEEQGVMIDLQKSAYYYQVYFIQVILNNKKGKRLL